MENISTFSTFEPDLISGIEKLIVQQSKMRQLSLLSKYLESLGVGVGALPNCIINSSSSSFSIIFKISDSHLTAFSTLLLCTSNST